MCGISGFIIKKEMPEQKALSCTASVKAGLSFGSVSSSFLSLSSTSLCEPLTASQDLPDNNRQGEDSVNWNAAAPSTFSKAS